MNKGTQLNKESGVSNEQGAPAEQVSNEQGVPVEQGVRGSNEQGVPTEQGVKGLK